MVHVGLIIIARKLLLLAPHSIYEISKLISWFLILPCIFLPPPLFLKFECYILLKYVSQSSVLHHFLYSFWFCVLFSPSPFSFSFSFFLLRLCLRFFIFLSYLLSLLSLLTFLPLHWHHQRKPWSLTLLLSVTKVRIFLLTSQICIPDCFFLYASK